MNPNRTSMELVSDREIVITRTFRARPQVVFDAWTKPEYVRRWWAPASRGVEVARNTRPNGSVGLSPSALPARGQVTIEAGIGFPPPPPRDSLTVIATATLTDGRQASASAPLTIVG